MATRPQKPSRNKHQLRTEETHRKLLAAGLRIFARDGFEASRIEDIAAEAGHTRGAFYANFDTKEDLFFALLEQQAEKRVRGIQAILDQVQTREEALGALRAFYLEGAVDRQRVLMTLEFKLFALRHGNARAEWAAAHQRIRASLKLESMERLLGSDVCDPDLQRLKKVVLEIMLSGLVLEHAYDPKRVSQKDAVALLGRMFDLVVAGL
ncbi:MAG TPA: helix-turn-helix domain-containing protein [Bryobacteraceae bacterium]|nr:helix-turn-helix domain-containing protein [Bryobacteraceae bacterium]